MRKVVALILVFLFVFSGMAMGEEEKKGEVTFVWNDGGIGVAGYNLYYGTKSYNYDHTVDVGLKGEYTMKGLEKGKTYYFSLTSYDEDGRESGFATEIVHTVH